MKEGWGGESIQINWTKPKLGILITVGIYIPWSNQSTCKMISLAHTLWLVEYLKYRFQQRCWLCKYLCVTVCIKSLISTWSLFRVGILDYIMPKGFAGEVWTCHLCIKNFNAAISTFKRTSYVSLFSLPSLGLGEKKVKYTLSASIIFMHLWNLSSTYWS